MAADWNVADLLESIAASIPNAPAIVDGGREFSWHQFDARAAALGAELRAAGLDHQAKVAVYLHNSAEFLEAYYGALLARLVPVNVNYRYGPKELVYLLDDSDTEAVIVHAQFAANVLAIAPLLPRITHWIIVGGVPEALNELAATGAVVDYTAAVEARIGERPAVTVPRSGDDLLLVYTGGTTGLPKGVMWQQRELFDALVPTSRDTFGIPELETVRDFVAAITQPGPRGLTASPMMHGTGLMHQFVMLLSGGTAVIYDNRKFDPRALLRTVGDKRVTAMVIVGDAFGGPLLEVLETEFDDYDLSALKVISSSGAIWSRSNKLGLLKLLPSIMVWDALASGEGFGVAASVSTADGPTEQTGQFTLGKHIRVRQSDGTFLPPGQAGSGVIMVTGPLPLGYYKDPAKTAATFITVDGARYSVPGDFVEVLSDGRVQFLGRGSACINTAGEKVFVEEVEEVVHNHPAVSDAACVGIPHERFGAVVCAVVKLRPGAELTAEELTAHVKTQLAGYKAPRKLVLVDEVPRTAQGKPDYPALTELAVNRLGSQ